MLSCEIMTALGSPVVPVGRPAAAPQVRATRLRAQSGANLAELGSDLVDFGPHLVDVRRCQAKFGRVQANFGRN